MLLLLLLVLLALWKGPMLWRTIANRQSQSVSQSASQPVLVCCVFIRHPCFYWYGCVVFDSPRGSFLVLAIIPNYGAPYHLCQMEQSAIPQYIYIRIFGEETLLLRNNFPHHPSEAAFYQSPLHLLFTPLRCCWYCEFIVVRSCSVDH